MGIVVPLRAHRPFALPRKRWHEIYIRVVDTRFAEETRWAAQWPIQNAGGFSALKDFTDANARLKKWHLFYASSRHIARFCREIEWLVVQGLVEVEIDGRHMTAWGRGLARRS